MLGLLLASWVRAEEPAPPPKAAAEPEIAGPRELPTTTEAADGLYVEFGKGVPLTTPGSPFSLVLRGRVQMRASARGNDAGLASPPDLAFLVRRARLVLLGDIAEHDLQLYLQLGLAAGDMEADHPIPLRDAVVTWTRWPNASVRFGQMKVPFSRQRLVSSSALQLVDRSDVNAELNLDRDAGLQLYSNDLFGLDRRVHYALGVYGGDGRNRASTGTGLLYVARLQIQPLGGFDDVLTEADLSRARVPRLSFGASAAYNQQTPRGRSTHGALLESRHDLGHLAADGIFKWGGWSLQGEALARLRLEDPLPEDAEAPAAGWGAMAQTGFVFANGVELAGRYTALRGLDPAPSLAERDQVQVAVGRYLVRHDLKIQLDSGVSWGEGLVGMVPDARMQLQVFF